MKHKTFRDHRIAVLITQSKITGLLTASLLLCASLFAPKVFADVYTLNPGGNNNPALGSAFPAGGTLVGSNYYAFNSGTLDGEITSLAYRGDLGNPYGGLTFTYSVDLFSDSSDTLSELTVGSFGGFTTDLSYNTNSGGVVPSNFTRSSGTGDVLHFFFSGPGAVTGGTDTALVVVQTGASQFQTVQGAVIDSLSANVSALAPVPEPAVSSLFAAGLGALFLFRRRSR